MDVGVAIGLAVAALVLRLSLPPDGFFFDDAWQAFAIVEGSALEPFTAGQTQPGFAVALVVWTQVVGSSDAAVVAPVLLAGAIGPPALYATLRALRHRRVVAGLLAAALVVSPAHVAYSGRVKVYVVEVLVALLVALAVHRLALVRWRPADALAWVVGSVVVASTSSFSLLMAVGAGIVVVVHARRDLMLRAGAVAVQALASAWILRRARSTHDAGSLTEQWGDWGGFIEVSPRLPLDVLVHLERVVRTYPGGPSWLTWPALVAALAGLAVAGWRGPHAPVARAFLVTLGLAVVGSVADLVPLGPDPAATGGRASLWLIPTVALGLSATLARVHGWSARVARAPVVLDCALVALATAVLASGIGHRPAYPPFGARRASERAVAVAGARDVVLLTRVTAHSFALYGDVEVEVVATPDDVVGVWPDFADERFVVLHRIEGLGGVVAEAERVLVVSASIPAPFVARELEEVAVRLSLLGFTPGGREVLHRSQVTTWERTA